MKVSIDLSCCMDPSNQDGVFLNIPICIHITDVSNAVGTGKDCSSIHAANTGGTNTSATQYFDHLKTPAKVQELQSFMAPKARN